MSINLPGRHLESVKSVTEKDREDLEQCFDVDIIAQSFIRESRDVGDLHGTLTLYYEDKKRNPDKIPIPKIIAKIETEEAVFQGIDRRNRDVDIFLDILDNECTFGIMVARGDLGGELGIAKVPNIQERLLDYANRVGKPAIVATQMLESMRKSPVPTRAEAEDVWSAIKQGADAVMLSGETANGLYPINSVEKMKEIIEGTNIDAELYRRKFQEEFVFGGIGPKESLPEYAVDVIGYAIVMMAKGAKSAFITTYATKGWSATRISRFRPDSPTRILALTVKPQVARILRLIYGVCPILLMCNYKEPDDLPREQQQVIDMFRYTIDWIIKNSSPEAVDKLGKNWRDRFIVATLAHKKPEWWDVTRALLVFKPVPE